MYVYLPWYRRINAGSAGIAVNPGEIGSKGQGGMLGERGQQMSVFTVHLDNKPGQLAGLCEAMAGSDINLVLSATTRADEGTIVFVADDESAAEATLHETGLRYTMREALTIRLENEPGTGALTFKRLADAGVNTDVLLPIRVSDELFFAVICVDDESKARQALGDQVVPARLSP